MSYPRRSWVALCISALGHFLLLFVAAGTWTARRTPPAPVVSVILVAAPIQEPDPEPVPSLPEVVERVSASKTVPRRPHPRPDHARPTPVIDFPSTTAGTSTTPRFGISMSSTSPTGTGPSVPVGNSLAAPQTDKPRSTAHVAPLAATVENHLTTKMPLPIRRCAGRYTDAAKEAAIEGLVVLDLVVGTDGRPRDIRVISGLGHGLNNAAITAAKACRFSPGERDGKPVAVRVRAFKIRFLLRDGS